MARKSIAIGCVFFGAILLYLGYGKTQSVMGGLSKVFSGGYSTETMTYLIGGAVLLMTGLVILFGKKG
ncbi:MAG: DUF3185 family protein [bacterium]|nr:DUF3185 family protein [bacterium]MDT8365630.1 DUF3185 family protein [bacterium]